MRFFNTLTLRSLGLSIASLGFVLMTGCGYGLPSPVFPPGAGQDEDLGSEIRHTRQWVWLGSDLGEIQSIKVDLSRTPETVLVERNIPEVSEWSLEVQIRVPKAEAITLIDRFINESIQLSKLNGQNPVFVSAQVPTLILEKVTLIQGSKSDFKSASVSHSNPAATTIALSGQTDSHLPHP